jgi:hypothetical protein
VTDTKRWRGVRALVEAAVDQGASAVERVHLATARRPFAILQWIEPIREPVALVQAIHDGIVSGVYSSVRAVNHALGTTLELVLDVVDGWPVALPPPAASSESLPDSDADACADRS